MKVLSDEEKAMTINPFDGDFGYQGDRVLKDKILTTKKIHECNECWKDIEVGTRARHQVCIFNGEFQTYYWHVKCLEEEYNNVIGE